VIRPEAPLRSNRPWGSDINRIEVAGPSSRESRPGPEPMSDYSPAPFAPALQGESNVPKDAPALGPTSGIPASPLEYAPCGAFAPSPVRPGARASVPSSASAVVREPAVAEWYFADRRPALAVPR